VEDYISTADQERILVAILTGPQAPWAPDQVNKSQTGTVKRKVQHYGYVFDYKTADVLRDRTNSTEGANCPPLPAPTVVQVQKKERNDDNDYGAYTEGDSYINDKAINYDAIINDLVDQGKGWDVLACVIEKTRHYKFPRSIEHVDESNSTYQTFPDINQLTVNQYKPGEGIGSHVDTPSAFGDGLISISLNSGIVMEFRQVTNEKKEQSGDDTGTIKKLVYLPPRSLLLMSGPARYEWEHQIVTRRTDTHQGVVLPRGLRISLTMRTALDLKGKPLPRVETDCFPPTWVVDDENAASKSGLATPDTERDHVHAVYDAIATQVGCVVLLLLFSRVVSPFV
jgi:alkylated DNA repair dioxygenase AlkB